jgi:predicted tellurium resistance membrane protein TerC
VLYDAYAALRFDGSEAWSHQRRWVLDPASRLAPFTRGDHDGAFVITRQGRRFVTAAGVCVFAIVLNEIWFAIDSVALLSVSKTTLVVAAATILATIAQRSWLYAVRLETIEPPRKATAALLGLIGIKMLAHQHLHLPHSVWLVIITGLVCAGILESLGSRPRSA